MSPGIAHVIASAPETKSLELGTGALEKIAAVFGRHFRGRHPLIVADPATFAAAGQEVLERLRTAGYAGAESFVFRDPGFYAEMGFVDRLEEKLKQIGEAV